MCAATLAVGPPSLANDNPSACPGGWRNLTEALESPLGGLDGEGAAPLRLALLARWSMYGFTPAPAKTAYDHFFAT